MFLYNKCYYCNILPTWHWCSRIYQLTPHRNTRNSYKCLLLTDDLFIRVRPPDMYLKKLVFEKGCMSYPFIPKRICFRSIMTVLLKTLHFVRCLLGRITSFLKYAAGVLDYNFSYIYSPTDTFALYENKEMLYDCQWDS